VTPDPARDRFPEAVASFRAAFSPTAVPESVKEPLAQASENAPASTHDPSAHDPATHEPDAQAAPIG